MFLELFREKKTLIWTPGLWNQLISLKNGETYHVSSCFQNPYVMDFPIIFPRLPNDSWLNLSAVYHVDETHIAKDMFRKLYNTAPKHI
jgi:hypothetical protein